MSVALSWTKVCQPTRHWHLIFGLCQLDISYTVGLAECFDKVRYHSQGSHHQGKTWKTWKMVKAFSRPGKIREFEKKAKIREFQNTFLENQGKNPAHNARFILWWHSTWVIVTVLLVVKVCLQGVVWRISWLFSRKTVHPSPPVQTPYSGSSGSRDMIPMALALP